MCPDNTSGALRAGDAGIGGCLVRDLGLRATADVILVENFLEELKDKVAR
jgi:hypothetical protein